MKRFAKNKVFASRKPERCPGCEAGLLERRHRSALEKLRGLAAKYQCRQCNMITYVVAEDKETALSS